MNSVERANLILGAMERAQPYTPQSIKLVRAEIEALCPTNPSDPINGEERTRKKAWDYDEETRRRAHGPHQARKCPET